MMVKTKNRAASALLVLCMAVVMLVGMLIAAPVKVKAAVVTIGTPGDWTSKLTSTGPDTITVAAGNTLTITANAGSPSAAIKIVLQAGATLVGPGASNVLTNVYVTTSGAGTYYFEDIACVAPEGTVGLSEPTLCNLTWDVTGMVSFTGGSVASGEGAAGIDVCPGNELTVQGSGTLVGIGGASSGGFGGRGISGAGHFIAATAVQGTGGTGLGGGYGVITGGWLFGTGSGSITGTGAAPAGKGGAGINIGVTCDSDVKLYGTGGDATLTPGQGLEGAYTTGDIQLNKAGGLIAPGATPTPADDAGTGEYYQRHYDFWINVRAQ